MSVVIPCPVTDAHLHFWHPARIEYFWLGPSRRGCSCRPATTHVNSPGC
jgi:predicted TIM-barrel fold metal-dependent hydrolase